MESLPRGTNLSRYLVLDRVGAGGRGIIYSAYDPELDRKIALKLLRPDSAAPGHLAAARARLLQEAKALARLSHPNVVSVHDVGTHEDGVFIAMDLMEGGSLREWLNARERSWRELVEVFLQAGRGLAAAHAASLVHRDFKPENVLVGKDGQVRVTDFGLARQTSEGRIGDIGTPRFTPLHAAALSDVNALAYMAPEQLRGEPVDARSDQFSFCVALHEALYRERPFAGDSVEQIVEAIRSGPPPSGKRARPPARLRRALQRGLGPNPADRHPSMQALLAELEAARRVPSKGWWLAAAAALVVLVAAGGGYATSRRARAQLCKGAEPKLAEVWSPPRKAAIQAAFLATGKPYAQSAWESAERALDAYAQGWVRMQTDACEATRLRREQSEETLGLRTTCLDRRLTELRALVTLFAEGDPEVVQRASQAVRSLEGLSGCADLNALSARVHPPDDLAIRAQVEIQRAKLAEASALLKTGKYVRGLELAQAIAAALQPVGYLPARAEALFLSGLLQNGAAQYKDAERTLYEALCAAEEGRDDELAAKCWAALVAVVGVENGRIPEGRALAQHAAAALARLGRGRAPLIEAELHSSLGRIHSLAQEHAAAVEEFERAMALFERELGPEDPQVATVANHLGYVLYFQAKYDLALSQFERALALRRKAFGPEHPDVANSLRKIGMTVEDQGRLAEARRYLLEALAIEERTLGLDHPNEADTLLHLTQVAKAEGKLDEALGFSKRALDIMRKTYGATHSDTSVALCYVADMLTTMGRYAESNGYFVQALAAFEKLLGPDHPNVVSVLISLGSNHLAVGNLGQARSYLERAAGVLQRRPGGTESRNYPETMLIFGQVELAAGRLSLALDLLQRAQAAHDKVFGADHPQAAAYLTETAKAHLALHQPAQAMPLLERARALQEKGPALDEDRAGTDFTLARALWDSRDRPRALELARKAEEAFRAKAATHRKELAEVSAWLKRRGRPSSQ